MKSIIINRMYAGEYLTRGIGGGEVINLLHSDDEVNYCFVSPYGMINPTYNDTVYAVIHTRLIESGCFEVIGISIIDEKNGQLIHPKGYKKEDRGLFATNELKEYIKSKPINYGGVPYIKENDKWPGITFKSKRLLYPKKQIFILDSLYSKNIYKEATSYKLIDKRFGNQPLLMYVDDEKYPLSYNCIIDMINNSELWEERIVKIDSVKVNNHYNFLSLINKEDDELSFSNMFSYFFSNYPELFVTLSKELLGHDIKNDFIIKREFHNIDLWIEDDKCVIVIENKIKSGINGVSSRHDFSEDGKVQSQLWKYYEIAKKYAEEKNKSYKLYLFVPNYNKLDLSKYKGSKKYRVIRYKDIYKFLLSQNITDKYYTDFCNALYKHTKDIPVDYSEIVMNYLIQQIQKQKK